jgi:hypothetical protein
MLFLKKRVKKHAYFPSIFRCIPLLISVSMSEGQLTTFQRQTNEELQ